MSSLLSIGEQRDIIDSLLQSLPLSAGHSAHLISAPWYHEWQTTDSSSSLPQIDNSAFITESHALLDSSCEGSAYEFVSEPIYRQLIAWYGGGPDLAFPVLARSDGTLVVACPFSLSVRYGDLSATVRVSHDMRIRDLLESVRSDLLFDLSDAAVFDSFLGERGVRLDIDATVADAHLARGRDLLVAPEAEPPPLSSVLNGCVGLRNLGNTCYLNSAIQCLAHTRALTRHLLDPAALAVNADSRLGMNGRLAAAFARLCRELWFGVRDTTSPDELKKLLGTFVAQFAGWQQQDAHEALTLLLDGIHEDLNHPASAAGPPVIGDGADAAWARHTAINRSLVVETIHGQYRSQLTCPECRRTSVVFDPFMSISLPVVPRQQANAIAVYFVPYEFATDPVPLSVRLPADVDKITDLILPQVWEQLGRCVTVAIGCPSANDGVSWAISPTAKVLFAFELPDDSLTYVLCSVRMIGKRTTQLRDVSRYFVVGLAGSGGALAPLVEAQLRTVWDLEPDLALSPRARKVLDSTEHPTAKLIPFSETAKFVCAIGRYTMLVQAIRKSERLKRSASRRMFANWVSVVLNPRVPFCIAKVARNVDLFTKPSADPSVATRIALRECFELLGEKETLGADDMWLCPNCDRRVRAEKVTAVWRVGDVVILHLRRFFRAGCRQKKLDTFVDFPHRINLREFIQGPQNASDQWYRLYAVSSHTGGLNGGHYTAHAVVQDPRGDLDESAPWRVFNDAVAAPANERSCVSSSAYVLFYERDSRGASS
jgi:ubiquitin carboxyl-terminal hydrolase 4/11/15